jgi:hypothetical protein
MILVTNESLGIFPSLPLLNRGARAIWTAIFRSSVGKHTAARGGRPRFDLPEPQNFLKLCILHG